MPSNPVPVYPSEITVTPSSVTVGVPVTLSMKGYEESGLFNGVDNIFYLRDSGSDFASNHFSVLCWIKPSRVDIEQAILNTNPYGVASGWELQLWNQTLRFVCWDGYESVWKYFNATPTITADWYHVGVVVNTRDDGWRDVRLYVNGVKVNDFPSAVGRIGYPDVSRLVAGASNNAIAKWFNGNIRWIEGYKTALTDDEMAGYVTPPLPSIHFDTSLHTLSVPLIRWPLDFNVNVSLGTEIPVTTLGPFNLNPNTATTSSYTPTVVDPYYRFCLTPVV